MPRPECCLSDYLQGTSCGWTIATLKELIDSRFVETNLRYEQRFLAQQEAMRAALTAAALATDIAEKNAEKWRASSNEWREAMNDREHKFIPREEALQIIKGMHDRINEFKEYRDREVGKSAGINSLWVLIAGAVGLIVSVVSMAYLVMR